jgi:hypothetical protein
MFPPGLFAILVFAVPASADDDFFETKIRPILAETCFKCHGGQKTGGGLRVDSREAILKGGDRGPALVAGDADASLIVRALRHVDEDLKMPPGKRLSETVSADFASWIKDGAHWPKGAPTKGFTAERHWAFEPVKCQNPPPDPSNWSDHPIDRFLAAKWRENGLHPVSLADKRMLLRRVTFDLTGLPPTPKEINDFLKEETPDVFRKVIDRLLASPRYGERWGRHWMDVARYADTAGDNADYPIPEARLYRDYIIDSFNKDKPYDHFVREQIAGDQLAPEGPRESYAERVTATGFLALSRKYATAPEELWHLTLEDAIETTGRAFLGLTLRCGRCHDHKFDPVTQSDYYALYGIFASTKFAYAGSEEFQSKNFPRTDFAPLVPPAEVGTKIKEYHDALIAIQETIASEDRFRALLERIAILEVEVDHLEKIHQEPRALKDYLQSLRSRFAAIQPRPNLGTADRLRGQLAEARRSGILPNVPHAYAVHDSAPVDEAMHLKGEPAQRGKVVKRNAPAFLTREPLSIPPGTSGRRQLAEWLTRSDNPLTARVMVNRIWQHHFGRGIVASPSNFGVRGEEPTHPELLDWLAARFVESGWSIKAMHRLILSSRAYQLASGVNVSNAVVDPSNRYLWRFDRRRLSAEEIRDAMLVLGGHLDASRPGAHPFPPIATWGWTQHNAFKAVYPSNHRSVYLMTQRLQRHPFLALFDGPDTNHSTDVRTSATVPLQALYLMNNSFVREQAEGFAKRLLDATADHEGRVSLAQELAWGRPPTTDDVEKGVAYVSRFTQESLKTGTATERGDLEAWSSYARILLSSNPFLYVD